jgi:putative glutamine amidotransferase
MKKSNASLIALLIIFAVLVNSCQEGKNKPLKIAISKEKSEEYQENYSNWLKRFEADIEWFEMYPLGIDSAINLAETCDGILITGGEDIFPGLYNKTDDTARCGKIDRYRDSLEIAMIELAIEHNIPIVGVCRGLQIINVSLGGSLIVDIPADLGNLVTHRQEDWQNCYHLVKPVDATHLNVITEGTKGDVSSNHHQGIENVGDGLQISATSADGLPEAIEWEIRGEKGFLMAVQWHPERMDTLHPFSAPIAKAFLTEARAYQESR